MDPISYLEETKGEIYSLKNDGQIESNSFESLYKRHNTTPEYEEPILCLEESKYGKAISSLIRSASLQNFNYKTVKLGNTQQITIKIETSREEKCVNVEITLEIENFGKYASDYPVKEVLEGKPEEILGLNRDYYLSVENEINDILTSENMPFYRKTVFFRLDDYDEEKDKAIYSDDLNMTDFKRRD